jgi:hypothetical protein
MMKRGSIANLLAVTCFLLIATDGQCGLKATSNARNSGPVYDWNLPPSVKTISRHYTMTARVRPLLLWISRSGVGGGRITWCESADGTMGLELLIGSDPARTPMKINRWGYVAERVAGSSAELVGVMTESEEQSIEEATAKQIQPGGTHAFRAIRGRLNQGLAQSTIIRLALADDFTYRDADALLRLLPPSGPTTRQMSVPSGVDPGFLFAVKGLVHDCVENYRRSGAVRSSAQTQRTYVYDATLYELLLKSSRFLATVQAGACEYHAVIESQFEARNARTGKLSKFSITYGTEAPNAEIPICIVYQPRWWFEAELRLEDSSGAGAAVGRDSPWKPGIN